MGDPLRADAEGVAITKNSAAAIEQAINFDDPRKLNKVLVFRVGAIEMTHEDRGYQVGAWRPGSSSPNYPLVAEPSINGAISSGQVINSENGRSSSTENGLGEEGVAVRTNKVVLFTAPTRMDELPGPGSLPPCVLSVPCSAQLVMFLLVNRRYRPLPNLLIPVMPSLARMTPLALTLAHAVVSAAGAGGVVAVAVVLAKATPAANAAAPLRTRDVRTNLFIKISNLLNHVTTQAPG